MAKTPTEDVRTDQEKDQLPSDQEGQGGVNIEDKNRGNRGQPLVPVPGSKGDTTPKSQPEKLKGPLSGEEDRSGTHTDQ
jgi:hypothetical protein